MYFQKTTQYNPSEDEQYSDSSKQMNHGQDEPKADYNENAAHQAAYQSPKLDYRVERELSNQDFSNRVPAKQVATFGNSYAGPGLLGFTYLHGPEINLNHDKVYTDPMLWLRVSNHEARHWDDEYQTKVIEDWMVDFNLDNYNIQRDKIEGQKRKKPETQQAVNIFKQNYWHKKVA